MCYDSNTGPLVDDAQMLSRPTHMYNPEKCLRQVLVVLKPCSAADRCGTVVKDNLFLKDSTNRYWFNFAAGGESL